MSNETKSIGADSTTKQFYIFQWNVGNFRFIGPFDTKDAASTWVAQCITIKYLPYWQTMEFTAEELQYHPTLRLRSSITGKIVERYELSPVSPNPCPISTLDQAYKFYVMTWDDTVIVTGPFEEIDDAKLWGASWQEFNDDNPQWQIVLFSLNGLFQPVIILDPNKDIICDLEAMRFPFT